jgi:hypothetical protein
MQSVADVLHLAFECSVHAAPREPGLTHEEIHEIARRLGLQPGEVNDALRGVIRGARFGEPRLLPERAPVQADFFFEDDPELRNAAAFEFVLVHLRDLAKAVGRDRAGAERSSIVANAVAKGLRAHDVEVAITSYELAEWIEEKDGALRLVSGRETYALPSLQINQRTRDMRRRRERLSEVLDVVRDVVARRSDGRPKYAEPLDAFAEALDGLGHARFRTWWTQTVAEMRRANATTAPMSACVLSAALSEAALAFVVARARKLALGTMASKTFGESPTRWKFEDLLASAAAGGTDAIFDQRTRDRADRLNTIRQRIHAGRLMADVPTGPIPDTRPEEAREALETVAVVVRSVLDWIDRHPAP